MVRSWFRKQLNNLTWFFVQMKIGRMLRNIGIRQVSVSGDTRFDRVSAIAYRKDRLREWMNFAGIQGYTGWKYMA